MMLPSTSFGLLALASLIACLVVSSAIVTPGFKCDNTVRIYAAGDGCSGEGPRRGQPAGGH